MFLRTKLNLLIIAFTYCWTYKVVAGLYLSIIKLSVTDDEHIYPKCGKASVLTKSFFEETSNSADVL